MNTHYTSLSATTIFDLALQPTICGQQRNMAPRVRPTSKRKVGDGGEQRSGEYNSHTPSCFSQSQLASLPAPKKRKSSKKVSRFAQSAYLNILTVLLCVRHPTIALCSQSKTPCSHLPLPHHFLLTTQVTLLSNLCIRQIMQVVRLARLPPFQDRFLVSQSVQ